MKALVDALDKMSAPGQLVESLPGGDVRCLACAHHCLIHPGRRGICQVRFNREGTLQVPRGYWSAAHLDPIEKKPLAHFLPGSQVLTFGMLGCNFHCDFCQNWEISQALRDPDALGAVGYQPVSAEQVVLAALRSGAASIASSYNEPIITAEWAAEIFDLARQHGLRTAMVSNGYASPEALRYLAPRLDAYKIDLKSMRDKEYRRLGGVLQHVLDSIRLARELGLWVEVVTLVVPGLNDSNEELWDASRYLVSVSPDIPWHVTGFHPDYQRLDTPSTSAQTLQRAAEIGQEAGLRYVYAGNLPGRVGSLENTYCPHCSAVLIQRRGYYILQNRLTPQGACPQCGTPIAGVWNQAA